MVLLGGINACVANIEGMSPLQSPRKTCSYKLSKTFSQIVFSYLPQIVLPLLFSFLSFLFPSSSLKGLFYYFLSPPLSSSAVTHLQFALLFETQFLSIPSPLIPEFIPMLPLFSSLYFLFYKLCSLLLSLHLEPLLNHLLQFLACFFSEPGIPRLAVSTQDPTG